MVKGKRVYMKTPAEEFINSLKEIYKFVEDAKFSTGNSGFIKWTYEYAIIRCYREFENFVLEILVAAMNQDQEGISAATGISWPKGINADVCRWIVVRDGSLKLRGVGGVREHLKKYLESSHPLHQIFNKAEYKKSLKLLIAFRNHSAHDNIVTNEKLKSTLELASLGSAGSKLTKPKGNARLFRILKSFIELGNEIYDIAPF